ncbi:hypothetical protein GT360_17520 [Vibrio astriarenae]|uniref:Bacterial transcriptional activator domain-containing protein n=1 Tax=Vibrio astriarenae TaxID=1481923 RepID=A0A7Z2YFC0_9VIBR|nr:hypothetical protein [Vibrio astriarenae]QIA65342.1 hypothetical protein GT360_17520 [Vibrio astriarenae]
MIKRTLIFGLLLFSPMTISTVVAQELSQYSATRVMRANELAQDDKLAEAISLLESIHSSRDYDKAFIDRMLGVFYWQNEQIDLAIEHITAAVSSGLLEDEQAWHTQKMLADLLLGQQSYSSALKYYYPLIDNAPNEKLLQDIRLRVAQSHYQSKEWDNTLKALVELHKIKQPKVSTLSLKLGAELQLERWKAAIPTLKQIINLEPSEAKWWRQLVGMQLRIQDDKGALATLTLAKKQRIELSQTELRLLSQLYAKQGVPEQAARQVAQLDNAKTDLKLLREQATYWQQAKEWNKATYIWLEAAKQEPDYHWNAAQIMLQQQRYKQALSVLEKVPNREEQVALAKTRAFYKLNRLEEAIVQAKRANDIKPSNQAKSWIKYLNQLRRAHS